MSVVAHSPFSGAKRLFEDDFASEPFDRQHNSSKRARFFGSPSAGRCSGCSSDVPYLLSHTTLAAVQALFPDMDEKTVADVLTSCGNNIDAAIKHLNELRLCEVANCSAENVKLIATSPKVESMRAPDARTSPCPETPEQWVEALVQEMAQSKDVDDARKRAAGVLQQFNDFLSRKHGVDASSVDSLQHKLFEVQKENAILKRAVQIQNQRIQERAQQEQEIQQLKHMLAQYQEQVRTLELSNYSLTLHLQKATHTSQVSGQRPPDVF